MAEYIEREAAVEWLTVFLDMGEENIPAETVIEDFKYAIPAADVEPLTHGRWVPFHSQAAGDIWYCSACEIGFAAQMKYCPNCGAKMDGAE